MSSGTVQQVKDKLNIVDVVSQYVKLERAGTSLRARCPFHAERTPSFHVSPDRGTYHCFGCNVGGDIFSFVEAIEGLDFKGALKVLAEKAGVQLVYEKPEKRDEREHLFELMEASTIFYTSKMSEEALKYLKERGITEATIKQFRLGWAAGSWSDASDFLKAKNFSDLEILNAGIAKKNEKGTLTDKFRNRIMFPIADSAGRIIAFSGRIFGEEAHPDAPKYLNSPETPLFHKSRILYGFDKAKVSIRKLNCAVLVEGQMDLLMSHQAGWENTVAVSGTAFTQEHAALIRRMTDNLVIALDADQAGIKAAGKAARAALQGGLNVKVAKLPTGLDPADLILKEGADAWKDAIRDSKDIITFLLDVLQEHAPLKDRFRRAVETIVLPFLSDVQSPIAREQYLREIAKRLDVSETAVQEAFEKTPRVPSEYAASEKQPPAETYTRAKQAYSILVWQRSLPRAAIDCDAFEAKLFEAIGPPLGDLKNLPKEEQEILRFSAERLYSTSPSLPRETDLLVQLILRERLQQELREATESLKKAENIGDEAEVINIMTVCKLLTTRIASLGQAV